MHDLKSQLRTYYHSVIWLRDPDEVIAGRTRGVTMAQELETLRTRRWWSQPAVGATAVALLALLMFGGGLLLGLRLGGGDDVADEMTTPTGGCPAFSPASLAHSRRYSAYGMKTVAFCFSKTVRSSLYGR